MKETLKNLKEGDILVKISENKSVWGNDLIIKYNNLIITKILKRVRNSNEEEDFYIYEMRCFSNFNIDNNPNEWELIDADSTVDGPSLHSISFIEDEFRDASKGNEIESYSFVVKDDTNKIWEEAMKHYPRIFGDEVLDPKELWDFVDSIAGSNWRICLISLGYYF